MKIDLTTKQRLRAAADLIARGMTLPEVAKQMGCSLWLLKSQHPNLLAKEVAIARERLQTEKLESLEHRLARQVKSARRKPIKPKDRASSWLAACEPPEHTLKGIRTATALAAAGLTWREIAAKMDVTLATIHYWRDDHAETWRQEYARAMEAAVVLIQSQAGTDAVLTDPQEYIRRARACQRWTKAAGVELFGADEAPTVSTFYRDYYLPVRLADNPEPTKIQYQETVDLWAAITGDPPLKDISCEMLARFKTCLQRMQGLKRFTRMSPNTVRKHLKHLQILLDKAGPPGYRNRDAAGIISIIPPWIKPPRSEDKLPRIVTPELLSQVYLATVAMEEPRLPGVKGPAWWKTLLVVAFNTQLRRRTLFEMRMDEIDWGCCQLNLPSARFKSHRRQIVHLNEVAMKHLRGIRTDRELVFPWLRSPKYFDVCFHRLQVAAGVPRKDHFGLHDLRKTAASILWEDSPQAAQYALGHSSMGTTLRYYVNGTSIVARALDALPQPAAFVG